MRQMNSYSGAVVGIALVLGPGSWGAPLAQEARSIAAVDCMVTYADGDLENRKPNYTATADRAAFAFLAPMQAVGEGAMLYSAELGGAAAEGMAAIKGAVVRDGDGTLAIAELQIAWPFTVLSVNGQYQSVIQMAHEQGVPVGLGIAAGDASLGAVDFAPGVFDPTQPVVGFSPDAAAPIHAALMGDAPVVFSLDLAGLTFSTVKPEPGAYQAFIRQTLVPAMEEAERLDAEEPCTFADPETYLDLFDF